MKILITGGCGFIGSNLAVAFRERGDEVTVFDNLSRRGSELLCRRVEEAGARFVRGDIRNPADLDKVSGADLMIECSAEPSVLVGTEGKDARFMVENNLVGALNCFEWAREKRAAVVFLSTSRVYPYGAINAKKYSETETRFVPAEESAGFGPHGIAPDFPLDGARSLYGATKLAGEIMLQEYSRQYDLPALINRCGVVAGPWQLGKVDQGVFTFWLANHHFGKPLNYIGFGGRGKQVRDLLHIGDLIQLVQIQADSIGEFRGEVFHAGGGTVANLSLHETTDLCREITGREVSVAETTEDRPADVIWYVTDNRRTTDVFGWAPVRGARTILKDTHDWLREHEDAFRSVFGG